MTVLLIFESPDCACGAVFLIENGVQALDSRYTSGELPSLR